MSLPNRKTIRLQQFDYASANSYFVTVCVQNRECLFGDVAGGRMRFNEIGTMIDLWWNKISEKFSNADLDGYVVMPNHFHGIVNLKNTADKYQLDAGGHMGPPLPQIIQWFKTIDHQRFYSKCKIK